MIFIRLFLACISLVYIDLQHIKIIEQSHHIQHGIRVEAEEINALELAFLSN